MRTADDMDTLLEIGMSLLEQGELRRSLSAFDEVLGRQPDSVPALLGSAAALVQLGAPEQAYGYVDLAVNLAPESAAAWRTATSVALAAGDGPMAKRAAARRLEISGDGIDGLMDLGLASLFDLDYQLARDSFAEAARVAPENEIARFWHDKLTSIGSEHEWLVEVGRAHCRRGRFARGLELFDRALGFGDSYEARLYAGRALLALGAIEEAVSQLRAALALAPDDPEATADLDLALGTPAHRATPEPVPEPEPPQLFCTRCGMRLLADAAFCVKCGASVR